MTAGQDRGRTRFVETNVGQLRVHCQGDGPPLLLINGIGAPLETWRALVPFLPGRELVAFDLPGCGMSSTPRRPLGMRVLAGVVADLIGRLGLRRADVIGYSFGGVVAQELAFRFPGRVERLILCATTFGWPSWPPRPLVASMMMTPARYYNRRLAEVIVPQIAGGRTARDAAVLREGLASRFTHPPSLRGYGYQLYAVLGWTSHPWLHKLPHPTLVLHGDEDPLVPVVNARCMARRIPNATLRVLSGAGHLMLFDEAPRAGREIDRFLTKGRADAVTAPRLVG